MTDKSQNLANEALLEEWVLRYRKPLLGFFSKRIPVGRDAEDLVQDVFVRLTKRSNLSDIERADGYIFQIAASVLTDHFRRRSVRGYENQQTFDEELHGMTVLTPERVFRSKESVERLIEALYGLPERTRAIFVLYHFENLKQVEIAEQIGISLRSVERHLAAGLSHLVAKL